MSEGGVVLPSMKRIFARGTGSSWLRLVLTGLFLLLIFVPGGLSAGESTDDGGAEDGFMEYRSFFEEVYESFAENYYKVPSREIFESFVASFQQNILPQLVSERKSNDYVRWRGAAYLVERLRDQEDVFSAFYPPKPAKEYEGTALAKTIVIDERMELGVRTTAIPEGRLVEFVEPRSDAYEKGLRENDLIARIHETEVLGLSDEEVEGLLTPRVDETVVIDYISHQDFQPRRIEVTPKEFFKQMVFPIETRVPGIFGLRIERFNRMTGSDVFRFLDFFRSQDEIKGLIIDLRDNPGGPPLAAREIAAFFLPPGDDFANFQKRGDIIAALDVPEIPEPYRYDGPIVILVNRQSGSAAELFSGILSRRGRAVLMGDVTAGQVMLKSMFHFSDESMVLLITARGHHPDGEPFSFQGIRPDFMTEEGDGNDLIRSAQQYFLYLESQEDGGVN
jgi:C-terminal processing protease CtpA/Prc